jgi:Tfp pilus assembly protein PilF
VSGEAGGGADQARGFAGRRVAAPCLALLAFLLFARALSGGFVLDDTRLVRDNALLRDPAGLHSLLTSDYWAPFAASGLYRPAVTFSYALNAWLGGAGPAGYHAVNAALHALNSLLVLALLRRLASGPGVATAGAFLFAAHAVHVEAVANIAGRSELLCAAFFLGSLLCHAAAREAAAGRRAGPRLASLALYVLALLSKESAIALPLAALLLDLGAAPRAQAGAVAEPGAGRLRAGRLRELAGPYAALLVVTAACVALRLAVLGDAPLPAPARLDNPLAELGAPLRALNALAVLQRYAGLLLFPLRLAYDHSHAQIPLLTSFLEPRALGVLGLAAAESGLALWCWRRARPAGIGLALLAVTLLPASNLLVPIGTILAERLLYLPSVGFCLFAAEALRGAAARLPAREKARSAVFAGAVAALVALHGARSWVRIGDWQSEDRLFLADLAASPGSARVQLNAGIAVQRLGDHPRALAHFARALEIEPAWQLARLDAATSLVALGRAPEAIAIYRAELELAPGDPEIALDLGTLFEALGQQARAREVYEAALRANPDSPRLANNLGFLLVDGGLEVERGTRLIEGAVAWAPDDPDLLDSLGWAYLRQGRTREALAPLRRSLALDATGPSSAERRAHLEAAEAAALE